MDFVVLDEMIVARQADGLVRAVVEQIVRESHADAVEVFVSPEIGDALAGPTPVLQWPVGSVIVEEGYSDGNLSLVAVIEKHAEGWFWAEFDRDGAPLYSGHPPYCLHCHDKRKDYSDWVYSFELPR